MEFLTILAVAALAIVAIWFLFFRTKKEGSAWNNDAPYKVEAPEKTESVVDTLSGFPPIMPSVDSATVKNKPAKKAKKPAAPRKKKGG